MFGEELGLFSDDEDGLLEWIVFGDSDEESMERRRSRQIVVAYTACAAAGYYMACCDHANKRARRDPNNVARKQRSRNKHGMDAPLKDGDATSLDDSSETSSEDETDVGRTLPKKPVGKVPEFVIIPSTTCEKQSTSENPVPKSSARKRMQTDK